MKIVKNVQPPAGLTRALFRTPIYLYVGTVLAAESRDADLLVLGSWGHGTAVGMLLGSVSECCVHHGACPVVVVRLHRPPNCGLTP
jgi:hypothetical protein